MDNAHVIDASFVRRLGNEFLDGSDQIRGFTRAFGAGRQPAGTFGTLTESTHATGEYDEATRTAVGYLGKLQNAYEVFAEDLGRAARHYEMAELENDLAIAQGSGR